MGCVLLHVKFEDKLSILVLRNKATFYKKKVESKTDEFSKRSKVSRSTPTHRPLVSLTHIENPLPAYVLT